MYQTLKPTQEESIMTKNNMLEAAMAIFKEKITEFLSQTSIETLNPDSSECFSRSLQQALNETGSEVFRHFIESHESTEDKLFVRGEAYTFKLDSPKKFMTLFGPMKLTRRLYQNASDSASYIPLDCALGVEKQLMTREVREAVAFACAHITPEETADLLKKTAAFHPHPTQIKKVIRSIGKTCDTHSETIEKSLHDQTQVPKETQVLAVSMDGANVMMREKTTARRGRPKERPNTGTAPSGNTTYKNAMVGAISCYGALIDGAKTPERLQSTYVAQMPEPYAPTFKAKLEAELEAFEKSLPGSTVKVLLCDGARNIWNYVENNERYNEYEKIIDYWHAVEHLSKASEALFGKGDEDGLKWYHTYADVLLKHDDGASRLLKSMCYYKKTRKLSDERDKEVKQQITFFSRNKDKMQYAAFRKRNLPIGSGPVEAACKTLVKSRMCRSGMSWSTAGGQHILQLRTYVKSDRWEAFWKHYNQAMAA